MLVLRRPAQHRKRDPEVVVPSRRALIDSATFAIFDLQIGKLLKSATNLNAVAKANQVGFELPVQLLEQNGPADRVDKQRAVSGRSLLWPHPVPIAADLKADDAARRPLHQDLGVGGVIAEVGNDQGILVILLIDRRQRAGALGSEQVLRQFVRRDDAQLIVRMEWCRRPLRSSGRGCARRRGR